MKLSTAWRVRVIRCLGMPDLAASPYPHRLSDFPGFYTAPCFWPTIAGLSEKGRFRGVTVVSVVAVARPNANREMTSQVKMYLLGEPYVSGADGSRHAIPETAPAYLGLFLAAQPQWRSRESIAAHLWPDVPDERAQHNLRVALNRLGALLERWEASDALHAERRRIRLDIASDLAGFRDACEARDWRTAAELPAGELMQGVQFAPYPALAEWLVVEREAVRRAWRKALLEAQAAGHVVDAALARYVAAHPSDHELAGPVGNTAPIASGVVSRDEELAQLQALVDAHRWVTVVGLPGSGKSTLVQTWAARQVDAQRRRTVLLAVNAQTTAVTVVDAIVDALVAPSERSPDRREALLKAEGRVVLDGLDPAGADPELLGVVRSLAGVPTLSVVASSRAPLDVAGEHVMRLGGLSTQARADQGSDAALLFTRQAQRMRPDFDAARHRGDIERIARACGGLPLALKLAGAASRWEDIASIARELERGDRKGDRSHEASLHRWLAPIWQSLAPAQREALGSLSLFPGEFDMAVATQAAATTANLIESLVDLCLVDVDDAHPPRLRLHALVRAYAGARLDESPPRRRDAVARWVAQVHARFASADVASLDVKVAELAEANLDDLLAAWPLTIEIVDLEALSTFVYALMTWHEAKGEFTAGERRLALALEALDDAVPAEAALLARLQATRAQLLFRAGDYVRCEQLALHARRLAEATRQRQIARRAIASLGGALRMLMRLDEARRALSGALASAVEDGDQRGEWVFNVNLANVENMLGDYEAAERRYRRAVEIARERGNTSGTCTSLINLANVLSHLRRFEEAEDVAQEALRLTHEHDLASHRPFPLITLAIMQSEMGKPEQADGYLDLIDACDVASVEGPVAAAAARLRGQLALDRGDAAGALRNVARSLAICVRNGDRIDRGYALSLYASWLAHSGRSVEAHRLRRALVRSPDTDAQLRETLQRELSEGGLDTDGGAPDIDLVLVTEQAILAARHAESN